MRNTLGYAIGCIVLVFLLVFLSPNSVKAKTNSCDPTGEVIKQLVGKWYNSATGSQFHFFADGRFDLVTKDGDKAYQSWGCYAAELFIYIDYQSGQTCRWGLIFFPGRVQFSGIESNYDFCGFGYEILRK